MKKLINLEKEDIKTHELGLNILIQPTPDFGITFTTEALEELIKDYDNIKNRRTNE
jgi:hypothetical protein